jgi:hypothetical protein
MKKQAYMIIAVIVLVTVTGLSSAKAQTNGTPELVANIPFAFSVGQKVMPAGEYLVRCINPDASQRVLQVRSKAGHQSAFILTASVIGKIQDKGSLVFQRYGDQYFFAQAWLPADSSGMQAPKSRAEKQIARELAAAGKSKEVVAITARR